MTYSNLDETVLDFTMGSGSCGVSAVLTGRNFIGIEADKKYYDISVSRIKEAEKQNRFYTVSEKDHQLTTQISKDMKTT
jgi:site-specific DNA-methyltransferase (adenine-specific)